MVLIQKRHQQNKEAKCTFYTHTLILIKTYQGSVLSSAVCISCGACYAYKYSGGLKQNLVVVETENAVCCELVTCEHDEERGASSFIPRHWFLLLPICCLCTSLTHNPTPFPSSTHTALWPVCTYVFMHYGLCRNAYTRSLFRPRISVLYLRPVGFCHTSEGIGEELCYTCIVGGNTVTTSLAWGGEKKKRWE